MTAALETNRTAVASPLLKARIAGVFYFLNILTILLAIFFRRGIIVASNPAATAANVRAHQSLFQLGFAFQVISTICSIFVAALFYELFKPVNKSVSLLAAIFRFTACAVAVVGYLFQLAPLQILGGAHYSNGIKLEDSQAFGLLLHSFSTPASHLVIILFGFHFVLVGYLISKSTFLPRILGLFATVAGLGALTFLAPSFSARLFPYFAAAGLLAEVSLTLWLLVIGVNVLRWNEVAAALVE